MNAEEFLRDGQVEESLAALRDSVRKAPADTRLRRFLFQLLCVLGQWEKGLTQLQVLRDLDAESMLLAEIYAPVVRCEALRTEVFAGKRSPLIFGEPEEWLGCLVQANQLLAQEKFPASQALREKALEAAPASQGTMDGHDFEWLADADSRLGPVFEVIMEGKYYWVPISRVRSVKLEPPADLRNLVWVPARFTWANGGEAPGFIPTRYPGSENAGESGFQLARKTEWQEPAEATFLGLGQRVLATDKSETPLLEVRSIEIHPVS